MPCTVSKIQSVSLNKKAGGLVGFDTPMIAIMLWARHRTVLEGLTTHLIGFLAFPIMLHLNHLSPRWTFEFIKQDS